MAGFYSNSATAGSNTTVNSIAIAGSDTPQNADNALRELAAQGRQFANDLGGNNTVGGTADAITITSSSGSIAALYNGLRIGFFAGSDNALTTTTLNLDTLGNKLVEKAVDGVETAIAVGDIQAGGLYEIVYRTAWNAAAGAWQLIDKNAMERGRTTQTVSTTTGGTSSAFTGIPPTVKRITIMFAGFSLSGTDEILVQIGDSGGLETSSYVSTSASLTGSSTYVYTNSSTAGFIIRGGTAANIFSGHMILTHAGGNLWISSHSGKNDTAAVCTGGGDKTLSATLDRLSILTNGSNTIDVNGGVNILYD